MLDERREKGQEVDLIGDVLIGEPAGEFLRSAFFFGRVGCFFGDFGQVGVFRAGDAADQGGEGIEVACGIAGCWG